MVNEVRPEDGDNLSESELILGHTAIRDGNGRAIPCGDIPLFLDDDGRAWFLEEFFHLEACPTCPFAEWGGWYGYSTLTRQRYMWATIQLLKRWRENNSRREAGLERTPLVPCKPMPDDPQPYFWPGYRWSETYGAAG